MDHVREFFGLFLILAFTAMLPGFVQTCPSCLGANLPSAILTTSVSVFSGTVESVAQKTVTADQQTTHLYSYDVSAETTWIGFGHQSAELLLPRLHTPARCAAQPQSAAIFFVIGPQNEHPLFWTCFPSMLQ